MQREVMFGKKGSGFPNIPIPFEKGSTLKGINSLLSVVPYVKEGKNIQYWVICLRSTSFYLNLQH